MSYANPKEVKAQQQAAPLVKEDEKIPLFLVKLWNIVEDPAYYDTIRWDESGYSFHILDPYTFCRNVLPQYFKHNNMNSLIRQLNMYGFRKMTPIERTSLARAESDQDHLEFSHPCFVRDHPELLVNIKRKAPTTRQQGTDGTVNVPSKDLSNVFEELHRLRERQKEMENKMNDLTRENEVVWQEMGAARASHVKQQQIVTKLVQFIVALLQPSKRLGKRHLMAIDEHQPKRARGVDGEVNSMQAIEYHNAGEVLDRLMREYASPSNMPPVNVPVQNMNLRQIHSGPIVSDVTDEIPATSQDLNLSASEVADYLNGMDQSIENCRGLIGDRWDDLDLDGMLSCYDTDAQHAGHSGNAHSPLAGQPSSARMRPAGFRSSRRSARRRPTCSRSSSTRRAPPRPPTTATTPLHRSNNKQFGAPLLLSPLLSRRSPAPSS
ncbi:Heat shock factor protein 1 [Aphelenchoides fujianensis]|nr:Heat shock factor protein 1 [Aphelenchoides fujianensis]